MKPVIRVATPADMPRVYQLTHNQYVEQGYITPQPGGELRHYPHLDGIPQTTVLVAEVDGVIVGTNSWALDGPAGLHVDEDFRADVDRVRAEGRPLGASWRIITSQTCRNVRSVVMGLIRETVAGLIGAGVKTALFSFNPAHEGFYQRVLNMSTVATGAAVHGQINTPAVLMRLDIENVPPSFLPPKT